MPATVIAERVGWTGSITWFRDNVRRLRPEHRRVDPADRLVWEAGDAAQCDLWFPPKRIPLEDGSTTLLPVLVIVAAHSRFITGRMIPTRQTEDLLLGSWELIEQLGRVPRRLIWDNEPGIGRGGRLAAGVAAFTGTLATRIVQLPPNDPESKGLVERRNGFFETSFMPGRSFASPADFNAQFGDWLQIANARMVRTIKARPVDLIDADRAAMLPLPPVPLHLGWREPGPAGTGLLRPPRRQRLLRRPDRDRPDGRRQRRPGPGPRSASTAASSPTMPGSGPAARPSPTPPTSQTAAVLREQARQPPGSAAAEEDLARDLADYDRAFGLIDGGEVA